MNENSDTGGRESRSREKLEQQLHRRSNMQKQVDKFTGAWEVTGVNFENAEVEAGKLRLTIVSQ